MRKNNTATTAFAADMDVSNVTLDAIVDNMTLDGLAKHHAGARGGAT